MLCHGRILSALSENVYPIFCTTKTAIELWNALENKYGSEEAGLKRFSGEKLLDFQMVDGKSILEQIHEFENIIFDLKMKDIDVHETILITALIKKLPPSWSQFKRTLKQKPENFSFSDLLISRRIEEKHLESQKMLSKQDFHAKAHVVENHLKPKTHNFKKNNSVGNSNNN